MWLTTAFVPMGPTMVLTLVPTMVPTMMQGHQQVPTMVQQLLVLVFLFLLQLEHRHLHNYLFV